MLQENLLATCPLQCPALETDDVDEAMNNHIACVALMRECARRHNELVNAIRGGGQ